MIAETTLNFKRCVSLDKLGVIWAKILTEAVHIEIY